MTTPNRTAAPRLVRVAGTCACLVVAWSAGVTLPAQAKPAPKPAPELSIAVDNGRSSVTPGERLTYTITVKNLGSAPVRLRLSQTVPEGAKLVTAGSHGSVAAGTARWTLHVPATGQATARSTLRVVDPAPPDLLRLASVACASAATKGPPLVCATDSDQLPAGAAAEQRQAARPAEPAPVYRAWLPYAGGGVLLAGAAAGGFAVRRRRRREDALVAQRAEPFRPG